MVTVYCFKRQNSVRYSVTDIFAWDGALLKKIMGIALPHGFSFRYCSVYGLDGRYRCGNRHEYRPCVPRCNLYLEVKVTEVGAVPTDLIAKLLIHNCFCNKAIFIMCIIKIKQLPIISRLRAYNRELYLLIGL